MTSCPSRASSAAATDESTPPDIATTTVAGVAALYAYESQQPEIMKTKREGLRDLYDVPGGHDYFEVHETADVMHSADERALLARHGAGHEAAMLAAAESALEATYGILDGVEKRRGR
jgi:pyrroloquinoline-quinone synthase